MKKTLIWLGIILSVILIFFVTISIKVYTDLQTTMDAMNISNDIKPSEKRIEHINISEIQPFSVLLLGIDATDDNSGRSDTMIVLTTNPTLKTTKMLSIPRDTYTEIVGKDFRDKINHAFSFGGIEMSKKTVENLLDIPIDYVAQINIEAFIDIINIVDGVTVYNSLAFSQAGDDFPIGEIQLNGEQALNYVQMRKQDPSGDFGRQYRQRQIVQGMLEKATAIKTITNYKQIFNTLGNNIRTNVHFSEIVQFQKNYSDSFKTIEQLSLDNGINKRINGIYYYIPDETVLYEVSSTLQNHLELKE